MRIFYQLAPFIKKFTRNSVLAIGIFDGLHLGHQKILKTVVTKARKENLPAGVMSFYPHPDGVLNHQKIKLIQTLEQRLECFRNYNLDYCLIISLNPEIASLAGEDFARLILRDTLQVKQVVVGQNFRFGHRRHCGIEELKKFGKKYDFKVSSLKPVKKAGHLVSSSLLRRWLEAGRVEEAGLLLGRPYQTRGKVVKGLGLGQKLGFPTANLQMKNEILPVGVYLSEAVVKNKLLPAVTNIGFRPTFAGQELQIETHLLDFSGKIYGQKISLFLLKKIRPEKKFSSAEKLKAQIARDVLLARKYFKRQQRTPGKPS
jgi:riboflavin kinase/FMN adenylyltransferase